MEIECIKAKNAVESALLKAKTKKLEADNLQMKNENIKLRSFVTVQKEKLENIPLVRLDDFEKSVVIGSGATSMVTKVLKKQREELAMKELKLYDHASFKNFLHESEILFKLRHPCIVRIYGFDYGDATRAPSIYLSLEPKNLDQAIKTRELCDDQKNRIIVEIILGMRYMHEKKLMHRDLKPANILLSKNNHVRISDFGLAKEEDLETTQTCGVGSLLFMAPERFSDDYHSEVDVYAFGIILIFIMTNCYPKYDHMKAFQNIPPQLPSTMCSWVVELIQQCLAARPESRPKFKDIFEIMKEHNFDVFNDTKSTTLTKQQQKAKEEIEHRILKIEAFEYQHITE